MVMATSSLICISKSFKQCYVIPPQIITDTIQLLLCHHVDARWCAHSHACALLWIVNHKCTVRKPINILEKHYISLKLTSKWHLFLSITEFSNWNLKTYMLYRWSNKHLKQWACTVFVTSVDNGCHFVDIVLTSPKKNIYCMKGLLYSLLTTVLFYSLIWLGLLYWFFKNTPSFS